MKVTSKADFQAVYTSHYPNNIAQNVVIPSQATFLKTQFTPMTISGAMHIVVEEGQQVSTRGCFKRQTS